MYYFLIIYVLCLCSSRSKPTSVKRYNIVSKKNPQYDADVEMKYNIELCYLYILINIF